MNKTILLARLVSDPEFKNISGNNLCKLRVANNRVVGKSKTEKSIFIDVNVWANQAEVCNKYLKKGSKVIIEGTLCQDSYKNKNGENVSKIYIDSNNVTFLDNFSKNTEDTEVVERKPDTKIENNVEDQDNSSYDDDLPF